MRKKNKIVFKEEIVNNRLRVYHTDNLLHINSFSDDVRAGLTSKNKYLLPRYFYDKKGSDLFEKICETEEYYPTRTEKNILKKFSGIISERNSSKKLIVELGSGSSVKTEFLIESFLKDKGSLLYVPVDVSDTIIEISENLTAKYRGLHIEAVISFYEEGMDFIVSREGSSKLILFLGSSIGNFSGEERIAFMKMLGKYMNESDRLLIGFDLIKDKEVLENAYNDSRGYTAQFNLNLLNRINRELEANFDTDEFEHLAFFNEKENRIEMHLKAGAEMTVEIKGIGEKIMFKKGEMIHTENSYKFNYEMIKELAENSGLEFSDHYTDEKEYFSLCAFKLK